MSHVQSKIIFLSNSMIYNRLLLKNIVILEYSLLVKEWNGHKDQINKITKMERPEGFITTSTDRHVKVWARDGTLWGDIATYSDNPIILWQLPYGCSKEINERQSQIIPIMKSIESQTAYNPIQYVNKDKEGKKERRVGKVIYKRSLIKPVVEDIKSNNSKSVPLILIHRICVHWRACIKHIQK